MKNLRKSFVILLSAMLLAGCSSTRSENVTSTGNSGKATADSKSKKSKEITLDDLETKEYKVENEYATEYLVTVKNKSDQTIALNSNATAYDANNSMLGAADGTIEVLGAGEQSVMYFYFDGAKNVDHVDYKTNMQYNTNPPYDPVISNLSVKDAVNGDNLTVAITNNGKEAAQFVEVYAVFCDANNTPLEIDDTYVADSNDEIAPGATQSATISYYSEYDKGAFDHVDYYLTGRANKS